MTVDMWINERENDNFVIEYDGKIVYDARKTLKDPAGYIRYSMIVEVYDWNGVTVLSI